MHACALFARPQHNSSVVPPLQRQVSGVGWSGSGLMIFYHAGVLAELLEAGVVQPGITPMAGTSGGSHVSALACAGAGAGAVYRAAQQVLSRCAARGEGCGGDLDGAVEQSLGAVLPADAWSRCRGKVHVHLTAVQQQQQEAAMESVGRVDQTEEESARPMDCIDQPKRGLLVSDFSSQRDLVTALAGSAYLHPASGPACSRPFRQLAVKDGGYSELLPCPPASAAAGCLRVAAVPQPLWHQWAASGGVDVLAPPAGATDIYPGMRGLHTLPVPLDQWLGYMFNFAEFAPFADQIYELGRQDARHWRVQSSMGRSSGSQPGDPQPVQMQ